LEPDEKSKRTCAVTAGMSHRGDHGLHEVYRLIELVAYYQEVASAVLEASREGMEKLSVLRVEQCEDA
jgi:hypothetical protein